MLLATGPAGQSPSRDVAQLILVGARLLSYEWESISSRAELRRLAEVARDRASTDPVTGLPNRETLLASIEREHELSKRGTVESFVVVCQLRDRESLIARFGEAMANLLLKDVAEVLGGAIRLWSQGAWPLSLVIITASFGVPLVKLFTLTWLLMNVGGGANARTRKRTVLYRVVDYIGRWSFWLDFRILFMTVQHVLWGKTSWSEPRRRPEA